jgi:hypothetical protein
VSEDFVSAIKLPIDVDKRGLVLYNDVECIGRIKSSLFELNDELCNLDRYLCVQSSTPKAEIPKGRVFSSKLMKSV